MLFRAPQRTAPCQNKREKKAFDKCPLLPPGNEYIIAVNVRVVLHPDTARKHCRCTEQPPLGEPLRCRTQEVHHVMFGLFATQASLSETECADRRASVLGTFCLFYQCWEDKHLAIHILKCIQLCFEQNEIPKEKTNRRKGQTAVKEPAAESRQDSPGMSRAPRGRGGAGPGGPRAQSAEGAEELRGGTAAAHRHRLCCDLKHQLSRPRTRGLSVIISETETYVQKCL